MGPTSVGEVLHIQMSKGLIACLLSLGTSLGKNARFKVMDADLFTLYPH